MAKQGTFPLPEERTPDEKKLRKRQKRLQEQLQKAYCGQARATERLCRAETRLQRRQARVQRLQERLATVEQQLQPPSHSFDVAHITPPETQLAASSHVSQSSTVSPAATSDTEAF